MDLLIILANVVTIASMVLCIGIIGRSWVVLMIESSIGYRILVSLLCVSMIVLLLIFVLMLITMFGY